MVSHEKIFTPWFPIGTHPVRRGEYDTRVAGTRRVKVRNRLGGYSWKPVDYVVIRLYWDGKDWKASARSTRPYLFRQLREWRGIRG